jgi:hypothetical protein
MGAWTSPEPGENMMMVLRVSGRRILSVMVSAALVLAAVEPSLAQRSQQWLIERSENGQACHVRASDQPAVPEAPEPHAVFDTDLQACQRAALLAKDPTKPCMFFSSQALETCNDSAKNPMWIEVRRDLLEEQITMFRLRPQAKPEYRVPFDKRPLMIGGDPVSAAAFPATLSFVNAKTRAQCTAMLVGPRVILTSAHCIKDDQTYNAEVVVGTGLQHFARLKCEKNDLAELGMCKPESADSSFKSDHFEQVSVDEPENTVYIAGFTKTESGRRLAKIAGGTFDVKRPLGQGVLMMTTGRSAEVEAGDSGAPAFNQCSMPRKIVGVQELKGAGKDALVTRSSHKLPTDQLKAWAKDSGICGLTPGLECKQLDPLVCPTGLLRE